MDPRLVPKENKRPRDVNGDRPSVHVDTKPRTPRDEEIEGGWHTIRRNNNQTKQKHTKDEKDHTHKRMSTWKEPNHVLWVVGTTTLLAKRAYADNCDGRCPMSCGGVSYCVVRDGMCYCEANLGLVAGVVLAIVGGVILFGALAHICHARRVRHTRRLRNQRDAASNGQGLATLEDAPGWPAYRDHHNGVFTHKELSLATKEFASNAVLGTGTHGTVYKARFATDKLLAVKRIHGDQPPPQQGHWQRVKMLASLRHPNLVPFYGTCKENGFLLLVFEYMSGGSLEDRLGTLTWEESANVALDVARALAYLHHDADPAVVHMDLKPSNVLLDTKYRAYLADFGTARLLLPEPAEGAKDEEQGRAVEGTPHYMAPEHQTTGTIGTKGDVYAFGAVLLELLTGMLAFDPARPASCADLVAAVSSQEKPSCALKASLQDLSPMLDKWPDEHLEALCELAKTCTAIDPADRPDMVEVIEVLEPIVSPNRWSYSRFRSLEHASEESTRDCLLCMDRPRLYRCLPCGHNTICEQCLSKCQFQVAFACPICRESVKAFTIAKTPETYVHWE